MSGPHSDDLDLSLRPATADDYAGFAALFPELGVDDPVPDEPRWRARFLPGTWVAARDGALVGYVFFEILAGVGYVRNVVVGPRARGLGIGRALMGVAAAAMRAAGCATWRLNVMPTNAPAIGLYRALGMERRHASAALVIPWDRVEALAGEAGVSTRAIAAAERAAIEARFELPRGQLDHLAAAASVRLVRLCPTDGDTPDTPDDLGLGFAAFDVDFPGCFPFRVARPTLARPLLEGLRPLARPEHASVGVVAEGDEALVELLLAAGARIRFRFVHMVGDLPGAATT